MTRPTNRHCQTCEFANGNPPFENHPNKAYCRMYLEKDGWGKPRSVTYEGKDCLFYRRASDELIEHWREITRAVGARLLRVSTTASKGARRLTNERQGIRVFRQI